MTCGAVRARVWNVVMERRPQHEAMVLVELKAFFFDDMFVSLGNHIENRVKGKPLEDINLVVTAGEE